MCLWGLEIMLVGTIAYLSGVLTSRAELPFKPHKKLEWSMLLSYQKHLLKRSTELLDYRIVRGRDKTSCYYILYAT